MCRLFGFRSNDVSTVHAELVAEANSLRAQSAEHKDGWGIAYYDGGDQPLLAHGLGAAHSDPGFEEVSRRVCARAVMAHVRLASIGRVVKENAHPFVHQRWTFAHNGTVRNFEQHREAIEALIRPSFRALIRGETDSERCFYLFLSHLFDGPASLKAVDVRQVAAALVRTTRQVAGHTDVTGAPPSSMNFMACDGRTLVATRRQRTLYFSERHRKQEARDPPRSGQRLKQLVIASEELSAQTHWHPVHEDTVVGVDGELAFHQWSFDELFSPA